jgi:hypothetical protein
VHPKLARGFPFAVRLTPPLKMTPEKALAYIEDDELAGCARRCSIPTRASARSAPRKVPDAIACSGKGAGSRFVRCFHEYWKH